MENQSIQSGTAPEPGRPSWLVPHRLALMIMWLLTTVTLVAMLASGVRNTGQFRVERNILHAATVGALLWYLGRRGPSLKQLPDIGPVLLKRWRIGRLISVLVIASLLGFAFIGGAGHWTWHHAWFKQSYQN